MAGNIIPLDDDAVRDAREALALAGPLLQEVIDTDIISFSTRHGDHVPETEHLASMDPADREEIERWIAVRDLVTGALTSLSQPLRNGGDND